MLRRQAFIACLPLGDQHQQEAKIPMGVAEPLFCHHTACLPTSKHQNHYNPYGELHKSSIYRKDNHDLVLSFHLLGINYLAI